MLYKGFSVDEVLGMGNEDIVRKMLGSLRSRKSKSDGSKSGEYDVEIGKVLVWMEEKGIGGKSGVRGKYDDMVIDENLGQVELDGMYESYYSRLDGAKKKENWEKVEYIESRLDEIKRERLRRKRKELLK